jgi:hypothetical protein
MNLSNLSPFQAGVVIGALTMMEQEIEALLSGSNHIEDNAADTDTLLTCFNEIEEARAIREALLQHYGFTDKLDF